MIKNAIVYNVELSDDSEDFAGFIGDDDLSTKPDQVSISGRPGFTANPLTGNYVDAFEGGYVFMIERWIKKISASALKEELNARIKATGQTLKRAEKQAIKDQIISEMVGNILPEPKRIPVYYHIKTNMLVVESSSDSDGDMVCGVIRKAIGSLKATTVYVGQGNNITSKLHDHLDEIYLEPTFFNKYCPVDKVELYDPLNKTKVAYSGDFGVSDYAKEILGYIDDENMEVTQIRLSNDQIKFTLTDDFKLKSIKFDYNDSVYTYDHDIKDAVANWLSESWYSLTVLTATMQELVKELMVPVNDIEEGE